MPLIIYNERTHQECAQTIATRVNERMTREARDKCKVYFRDFYPGIVNADDRERARVWMELWRESMFAKMLPKATTVDNYYVIARNKHPKIYNRMKFILLRAPIENIIAVERAVAYYEAGYDATSSIIGAMHFTNAAEHIGGAGGGRSMWVGYGHNFWIPNLIQELPAKMKELRDTNPHHEGLWRMFGGQEGFNNPTSTDVGVDGVMDFIGAQRR